MPRWRGTGLDRSYCCAIISFIVYCCCSSFVRVVLLGWCAWDAGFGSQRSSEAQTSLDFADLLSSFCFVVAVSCCCYQYCCGLYCELLEQPVIIVITLSLSLWQLECDTWYFTKHFTTYLEWERLPKIPPALPPPPYILEYKTYNVMFHWHGFHVL